MQTVYILKNCIKSHRALIILYNQPDISTNIIIVDSFHYKVLMLDKRVTVFPFIINTAPTNTGLIPNVAKVLPLELFMNLTSSKSRVKPIKLNKNNSIINNRKQISHKDILRPKRSRSLPVVRKRSDGGVNIVLN